MKVRPMPETDGAPPRRDDRSQPRRSDGQRAANGAAGDPGASGRDAPLYGALDLGTNNCRLLIAKPARDGFRVVDSFSRIVRLGEGLSRTGRLDDAAMDRAYEALMLCGERVAKKGVDSSRLMAVATQACRQAENGPAFIERVRVGTGLKLRIIDPVEEARLAVRGCLNLFDNSAEAVLVVDGLEIRPYTTGFGSGSPNIGVALMAPQSHGRVSLAAADPSAPPWIEHRYDSEPGDLAALQRGCERVGDLLDGITALGSPQWSTSQHLCGTAPMGLEDDEHSVVDPQCRVRGVANLWVIDGSVLPKIPGRGPHATIAAIAHRAAEFF